MKLCECGCGNPTPIANVTHKKRGWIKGYPIRFILGHSLKNPPKGELNPAWKGGRKVHSSGKYSLVYAPNHPRNHQGYVYEHILQAERALGKSLPEKATVHHYSEIQLVICKSQSYHMLIHLRTRALRACGHTTWRKCIFCKEWDAPENVRVNPLNSCARHRSCENKVRREKRAIRKKERENGFYNMSRAE